MEISKKHFLFFIFLLFAFYSFSQNNVGIGTNTPNPSSALDITSTNQGVLVPRLTSVQRLAIVSPANGLLVYDTNFNCFYYYIASTSTWTSLCSATGAAGPTGATGVNGISCWDLNSNGINDLAEDTNGDGIWNALDCGAIAGATGATGATGTCSILTYGVNGTSTTITSVYPTFTAIPGLTQTITLTAPATLNISTTGGLKPISSSLECSSIIQIQNGGVAIPNGTQSNNFITNFIPLFIFGHWAINTTISLPAGTYTFSVKGSMEAGYSGYMAGVNSILTGGSYGTESSLIIQVFY